MVSRHESSCPTEGGHRPVLLEAVLAALDPKDGEQFVDATFGGGGYSRALLRAANCVVWGLDRDPEVIRAKAGLVTEYSGHLFLIHGRFGDMQRLLAAHGVTAVDGIAFDLGISSTQVDAPERGFSFRLNGPLDMRMDQSSGRSAAEVVNELDEDALAEIIRTYGEERMARRIAAAIVGARENKPFRRTKELADLVRGIVPRSKSGIDPATRTFQALRIYVNEELDEIDRGLGAAESVLRVRGRLAVVSYHSLEDRRVKGFLRERSGVSPRSSRHLPARRAREAATFRLLFKQVVRPAAAEIRANPRARSARLRAAERTAASARERTQ